MTSKAPVTDPSGSRAGQRPAPLHGCAGLAVVTGAAGFIGSTLGEALLGAGWRVRGVDAFTENYDTAQKRANVAALVERPDFELVETDLIAADLPALLESADVVAHLAGEPGVSTSWGGGFGRYVERNVLATQRLLDAAAAREISRFVYASSSSVYGGNVNGPVPETTNPRPASPYGVTKLAAEHLVGVYAAQGLPAVSLRYFSVYGPRQRPDMALHRFVEAVLDGRAITVYGDGTQARDFTYVGDVVAATIAALTADLEPGTVLNIAGGRPVRVGDLVALVGRLLDVDTVAVEREPERHGDVARTDGALDAARARLGWAPGTDLAAGVRCQIDWHLARRAAPPVSLVAGPALVGRGIARTPPRLLIYTQDGLGLGHLRRAGSLAAEFLRSGAGGAVLTISDSPLGTLLHDVPNHDYLKLPSIVKAGPGSWNALTLPLAFRELRDLRSQVILDAARAFRPDVMLVDHMPHGAMGELTPTLDALRDGHTRVVLGLRDIIDAPDVVQRRWKDEGALEAIERYYDRVLLYGSRDVFDLPEEYGWPLEVIRLVRDCGYVCMPDPPDHPKRIRTKELASVAGGKLVVAMAGGGADAYELLSALLDAVPEVGAAQPCAFVVVTGPFLPDAQRQDLKKRAEGLPVRIRTTVRDPLSYLAAADLVVAMAGYNTTTEVLRVGTPALLVPRRGPSAEQRMRARRFAEMGWVSQLDPDDLTPGRLAGAALALLTDGSRPRPIVAPDLGGLGRAVAHLHATTPAARVPEGAAPRAGALVSLNG